VYRSNLNRVHINREGGDIVKKTALLVALSALLLSAMIAPVLAGPSDVVINVGDWFKYERKVPRWESIDPFLVEGYIGPLSLADNQTNYVLYTVTDITPSGSANNVTFLVTYNWKNGSETTETMVESVSNASTGIFMIGANMNAGDMVSDWWLFFDFMDYPPRYINETFDFVNPDGTRPTNKLEYNDFEIFGSLYNYTFWFDKATGIRVYYLNEGNVVEFGEQAAYIYTVEWNLVESSISGMYIPEVFTTIAMLVILSASTASIVLYRRKKLLI